MKGGFREVTGEQVSDSRNVSQRMIEKSMHMRALAYLAEVKASLLTKTIFEMGKSKKTVSSLNRKLKYSHNQLELEVDKRTRSLQESEAKYRALVENQGTLFTSFLPNTTLTFVNQAYAEFRDMPTEALIGERWIDYCPESERPATLQALETRTPASPSIAIETEIRRADGESHWIRWLYIANFDDIEAIKQFQAVGMDITGRKQAEQKLAQYRDHLEELVESRTHELEEANKHLKDLDRLKSMFIASMSHELRTPMNSILGFTDLMLQGLTGEINDVQRDQLTRVHGAGKHLLMLITDIIDLSKVEAGKLEALPRDFELGELLDEALQDNLIAADKKGLELTLSPLKDDISMHTDRARLLQCLLNLISNAVKYSKTGSIHVSARRQDDEAVIEVRDEGIGMSPEQVAQLFQPFVRIDSELSVKAGGTGLGLYLTRKLAAQLLGGSVTVQSEAGVGSCFTLTLPLRLEGKGEGKSRRRNLGGKA